MSAEKLTTRKRRFLWWSGALLVLLAAAAASAIGFAAWQPWNFATGSADGSRGPGLAGNSDPSNSAGPRAEASSSVSDWDRQAAWEQLNQPVRIERRLLEDVRYLASDQLEGRGIGTQGIELAAEYIAAGFEEAGLETRLFEGEPFQRFSQSRRLGMNGPNRVSVTAPDGTPTEWVLKDDFTPLSISASGTLDMPLALVGYGITAPEADYDEYAGMDVSGKAVIILRHEPRQQDADSPFNGADDSEHSYLTRKITNAIEHGAAAVLFCTDTHSLRVAAGVGNGDTPATEEQLAAHDGLLNFRVDVRNFSRQVPVLHVRRAALQPMIHQATGGGLGDIEMRIDERLKPQSTVLPNWRLTGEISVGVISQPLRNVIAIREGEGPAADETIVIGAHYDHLGYGGGWGSLAPWTRAIHNGADDNASGTAVIIELARLLAQRPEPFRRRLMFIAFTAEESGLVGSEYYVAHPLVPMEQTVAMLNFDMVGYLRQDRLEIDGTGTAVEFDPLLYKLGIVHGLRLIKEPGGYGPSDHATFVEAGVPVMHFFTGFHDHYHRPSDDYERLNLRGMRRISELGRDLAIALADSPTRPQRQMTDDMELLAGLGSDVFSRPTVGLAPWGLEGRMDNDGYLVTSVAAWGLAAKSGIRAGDRLLEIGTQRIASEADYAEAIRQFRRGAKVTIVLRRGPFELEVDVRQ